VADLTALLNQAAEEVLENMFFSGVIGEVPGEPDGERLCATVAFAGSNEGELTVSATASTVAVLAAAFLGIEEDELADTQVRSVAGELANVLCGALLGHLEPTGNFRISPPRITDVQGAGAVRDMPLRKYFELMEGDLAVGLTVN
jgi:CheY-specific phosphatase CheX